MSTRTTAHPARRGQPASRRGRRTAAERGWLALVLAVLFCFCLQTSVVQAHFHVGTPAPADARAAAAGTATHAIRTPVRPDTPASCPICRELVYAGHFLPGAPPSVPVPVPAIPIASIIPAGVFGAAPQRSHSWYGRGPPIAALVP